MRRALILLLVLAAAGSVRAEGHEETERRLKLSGMEPAERERIHEAIRRGVARLREVQDAHGRIVSRRAKSYGPGQTALAGLALRHSAIPDGVEGARLSIRYLLEKRAKTSLAETYPAGILAMLLASDESQPRFLAKLHDNLSKGPRNSGGYWSYGTSSMKGSANLSTAQFGALGLWAGERRGIAVADKAWMTHLDALFRGQELDGSWAYIQPWRSTNW